MHRQTLCQKAFRAWLLSPYLLRQAASGALRDLVRRSASVDRLLWCGHQPSAGRIVLLGRSTLFEPQVDPVPPQPCRPAPLSSRMSHRTLSYRRPMSLSSTSNESAPADLVRFACWSVRTPPASSLRRTILRRG